MGRALVWVLLASPLCAAWLKLDTPHFQVLSQTGETALQAVAAHLETAYAVFPSLEGQAAAPEAPVRVFVFASQKDFDDHRSAPGASKTGYFQHTAGSEVIAFVYSSESAQRVAFHEYAHLVLHRSGGRLPLWLEEGLAEVYAETQVQDSRLLWGGPAHRHLQLLRSSKLLAAEEFFNVQTGSPIYIDPVRARLFYAESWALAHLLTFAPAYSGRLQAFRSLLAGGVAQPEAFERAFGRTPREVIEELAKFIREADFSPRPIGAAPRISPPGKVAKCSPEEASLALAGLLLQIGRTEQAERIYHALANRASAAAASNPHYGLGSLALANGRAAEAILHFERAIESGSTDASLYFEYAMLLRDRGEPAERIRQLLEQALELNPSLTGLQQFLGNRALDENRFPQAVSYLERATVLDPKNAKLWISLALAQKGAGNREAALSAARTAQQAAAGAADAAMASSVLEGLARRDSAAQVLAGPKTVVPDTWKNPQGDRKIDGALVRVDCRGASALLHLRAAAQTITLAVTDARRVLLRNAAGPVTEFRCGSFEAVQVTVEYRSTGAPSGAAGEVTAIEFH
jgi:tetratricopeptide (TPR) repeat protein